MMAHAPRATRVTPATLEKDVSVSSWNDLVRALGDQFGMSEKVAVLVLSELSAWHGKGYKSSLCITSADVKEIKVDEVRRDFNGRNHSEVMQLHSISQRTLYRIIGQRG